MRTFTLAKFILASCTLFCFLFAAAEETVGYYKVTSLFAEDGSTVVQCSPNGKYAVSVNYLEGKEWDASVWNSITGERTILQPNNDTTIMSAAFDVNNDGTVVVGHTNLKPGYWVNKVWHALPTDKVYTFGWGVSLAITESNDTIIVGHLADYDIYNGIPACWINGKLQDIKYPEKDKQGDAATLSKLFDVSEDGKTMLGSINYNVMGYMTPFIMNRETQETVFLHEMKVLGDYTQEDIFHYDFPVMSRNGKYVVGWAWYIHPDKIVPFFCDVEKQEITIYGDLTGAGSGAVDNSGNFSISNPAESQYRKSDLYIKDANGDFVSNSFDKWLMDSLKVESEQITAVTNPIAEVGIGNINDISGDGKTFCGASGSKIYNWVITWVNSTNTDEVFDNDRNYAYYADGSINFINPISKAEVYSVAGAKMLSYEGETNRISASLGTGVYIVKMKNSDKSMSVGKIIVK